MIIHLQQSWFLLTSERCMEKTMQALFYNILISYNIILY